MFGEFVGAGLIVMRCRKSSLAVLICMARSAAVAVISCVLGCVCVFWVLRLNTKTRFFRLAGDFLVFDETFVSLLSWL